MPNNKMYAPRMVHTSVRNMLRIFKDFKVVGGIITTLILSGILEHLWPVCDENQCAVWVVRDDALQHNLLGGGVE